MKPYGLNTKSFTLSRKWRKRLKRAGKKTARQAARKLQ